MQPSQLGAGLDADVLDQRRARPAIRVQRLGLPARAIQREHALRVQALAQRLARQQRLQLRQHLTVAPAVEVLVDRDLQRGRAQLFQAPDLRSGKRLVGDVRQGGPAPQAQRLACGALGEQALEAPGVDLVAAELQLVAAPARRDRAVPAVRGHRLAQLRDVQLHHLGRRRRRLLAPQPVDQPLGRDRGAGVEREHREQGTRLRAAEDDRAIACADVDGSEEKDLHGRTGASRCRSYVGTRVPVHRGQLDVRWVWPSTRRLMRTARARNMAACSVSPVRSATPARLCSTPATS